MGGQSQGRWRGLRGGLYLSARPARVRSRGNRQGRVGRRHEKGRRPLRSHHQLSDRHSPLAAGLRREGHPPARRAGQRRAGGSEVGPARNLGRRRQGGVRQIQEGARCNRGRRQLHRPDRRGLGRQAGAQLRRLCHPDLPCRSVFDGHQGRRRAVGPVGGRAAVPRGARAHSIVWAIASWSTRTTRRASP